MAVHLRRPGKQPVDAGPMRVRAKHPAEHATIIWANDEAVYCIRLVGRA